VTAEPVSNTVLLSAEPALRQQLVDILTAIDKAPPQVMLSALVLEVPDAFIVGAGLNIGAAPGTTTWTLSAREMHMFMQFIRWTKERGDTCDILSRPTMQVADNQTGYVQVGQQVPDVAGGKITFIPTGLTFKATPRVTPEGRLLLRTNVQITEQGKPAPVMVIVPGFPYPLTQIRACFNTQSVESTIELKPGETLVTRVGSTLVIVSPTVIAK
jgi:type II secretory pathway component GspD/PulD (secretin)